MIDTGIQLDTSPETMEEAQRFVAWLQGVHKSGGKPDVVELMTRLYKVADLFAADVAKLTECKKGCSHCCKIPVDLHILEVEYLRQKTGWKITKGEPQNLYTPCPFLSREGVCQVYEHRPLACRSFFSMDGEKNCIDPHNKHFVVTLQSGGIPSALASILESLDTSASKDEVFKDIRYWFEV